MKKPSACQQMTRQDQNIGLNILVKHGECLLPSRKTYCSIFFLLDFGPYFQTEFIKMFMFVTINILIYKSNQFKKEQIQAKTFRPVIL